MELVEGCAVSVAGLAAVTDVWSRRIPNWVTFGTLLLGVVLNTWLHGAEGLVGAVAGAALGLALLLPFYAMGAVGAGDVKLLGALGALLGPQALLWVALYAAIVCGVRSAFILARRGRLSATVNEILIYQRPRTFSGATGAFSVMIAAGVVLSLILPGVIG
ncbi:MAG TPA: prepilin peptidase [Chloroflexota bacterium]|jgi:prepilin peptidase CpaA